MTAKETNGDREVAEGEPASTSAQRETLGKMQSETIGKGFEAIASVQKELLKTIEEANREWLDRMELERNLASELTAKLTAVRSAPEAMSAYQEWMARRVQLIVEDNQKFVSDCQKFANAMMRSFSAGGTVGRN